MLGEPLFEMMIADLHEQLAALHRGWRAGAPLQAAADLRQGRSLAELVRGYELSNVHGELLGREDMLTELYTDGQALTAALVEGIRSLAQKEQQERGLAPLSAATLEQVAFLDIETTGLHGRPVFLVGAMTCEAGELVVRQYFARDYSEERALLWQVHEALSAASVLVSFNGKAFDVPYLRDRMAYHRLPGDATHGQVDLLHPCRRRWRRRLPDCRLQTLERHLCRRVRTGDIPGYLIPQRYHEFVHSGDPKLVAPIFHHNRLDLVAMAELLVALLDHPEEG